METVLIVDHEPARLSLLEHAVSQKLHYRVVTADDVETTIQVVLSDRQPRPDLMLCDWDLSSPGGIEAIRTVRTGRPDLPIIVVTQFGERRHIIADALRAGANDFLTKPITLERLRHSLATVLLVRRLTARIEQLERVLLVAGVDTSKRSDAAGESSPFVHLFDRQGRIKKLESVEEEVIRFVLQRAVGCMTRAARNLGIGRSTLYRRVTALRLHDCVAREQSAEPTALPAVEYSLAD
jgi:DNA-binding NtrC family response regulator